MIRLVEIPRKLFEYSFEKLEVWKISKDFVIEIYKTTSSFPKEELFGLTSQIRRAAISIPANLAEGSSRTSIKDQARFTVLSYSSALEVLNHIIISKDLKYISNDDYALLRKKLEKITNMLNALSKAQQLKIN